MSQPDSAAGALRERLRRLAGGASRRREPLPAAQRPSTPSVGDGVEVIRARFALTHRHGRTALGECARLLAERGEQVHLSDTLWLDTETTGLAGGTGTHVFLVGLGSFNGTTFTIEQFLLRRLSAEGRFLLLIQESLARARHVVTFNGQRFDLPLLEARFILTRLRPISIDLHTDLIHPARRLWHRVLGTHRLSMLEAEILGAPRPDDIPGWMIPQTYVQYLRSADRMALEPILSHNRSDLLALLGLHAHVARVLRDPDEAGGPIDWEGAGVLLARRGNPRQAAMCFERALAGPVEERDRWRVMRRCVRQYRVLGEVGRPRALWEDAARTCSDAGHYRPLILVEVAKARERAGDPAGARAAAEEALRIATHHSSLFVDRLRRRVERLDRRSAAPS
ncbi:MAG TPA: ribonuclease H-like domain-containing protein [bacterium]|nr:ribonuclease H-like domain-containing protein [bacterium]